MGPNLGPGPGPSSGPKTWALVPKSGPKSGPPGTQKLNFPKSTNRQLQKKEYFISGNFYLAKISKLISNGGFISRRTFGFEIKKSIHLDIDTKIDFLLAKTIMKDGLFKKIK